MSASLYTVINWCPGDSCDPCQCPLLNATPYETEVTTNVKTTYVIAPANPNWAPVSVDIVTQQITTLTYNLSKAVPLFLGADPTPPKACAPWFAWPLVQTTALSYEYIIYDSGGPGPEITIPYTTMFGAYAWNAGPEEGLSGYSLRSDTGYSLSQTLPIDLSVSYLGVEIFKTRISFNYQGYYYSTDAPAFDVRNGLAFYVFTGATMSNIPTTPFEVSPSVVNRMGLTFPDLGNVNQPINPKTGNYMFTGFVYDGPIDTTKDIVFIAKAVSSAVPFMPPAVIEPQSVAAAFGDENQPPFIDSQIAGCALYGTRSDPLSFYDY